MSVYSGFPTRNHETVYNTVLFKLINILQFRVKLYSQGVIPPNEGSQNIMNEGAFENSYESNFIKYLF